MSSMFSYHMYHGSFQRMKRRGRTNKQNEVKICDNSQVQQRNSYFYLTYMYCV